MTILRFPEYAPDISPFGESESQIIQNVFPRKDGYGPVPSITTLSVALNGGQCRGFFYARNADGTVTIFAATATRLFRLNNTDFTWIPCSKVQTCTISIAAPAVVTLNAHGLTAGDAVVFYTTGALPTGLTAGTVYYVISAGLTANAFEVSATSGGTAINTSGSQSGTQSVTDVYQSVPTTDHWQFAQFNNFVFACQINVVPQVIDLTALSTTAFADLGGSPPQARYITVVNRFLVLSGLGTSTPYRIQWSGLNATTTWTSGVNSSDFQDLPDGGIVRGVGGGEYGFITQDGSFRRMIYAPGSAYTFQIERVSQDKGIFAPFSLVRAGDRLFYCGNDGFKVIAPGGYPQPIGKEKVDRTFFADIDNQHLEMLIGAADPGTTRVYWCYKSHSGSAGQFDKILVYDYALDKWSIVIISGEYLATLAKPSVTLEGLNSISASIDALTFSLDDVSTNVISQLSVVDTNHRVGFLTSSTYLEALLDTEELEHPETRRMYVKSLRPITDAATCFGSIGERERIADTPIYSTEQSVDAAGRLYTQTSTRMARGRLRIPAGTVWTFCTGMEPDYTQLGMR